MTNDMCVTHRTTPAQWFCPKCDSGYCNACISKRATGLRGKEIKNYCPKCNVEAEWVGAANLIPPFWMRLHKFFVYPVYPGPLTLLIIMSLVFGVLGKMYFVGGLIRMFSWGLCLKYAFEIMRWTGRGKLVPPKIDIEVLTTDFRQVFQQYTIFVILAFVGYVLVSRTHLPILLVPYLAGVLLFLPALVIMQVATGSVWQALNPFNFVQLAWRIGPGYLGMYFFLVLLLGAPTMLFSFIDMHIPTSLHDVLLFFCQQYYTFVMYHLMGYVLLQYHHEIGYEVSYRDFEDVDAEVAPPPIVSAELLRIETMIQDGQLDEALSVLRSKANMGDLQELGLLDKYYGLLKVKNMDAERLEIMDFYIRKLLDADKGAEAVRVYEDGRKLAASFLPRPEVILGLGDALEERGLIQDALKLYDTAVRRYPGHAELPEMYFRAAIILNERMTQPDKAKSILQAIQQKFPGHPVQERVGNYLATLN